MSLDIKRMIAVASGKGGVGKSTTALNLALSLQKRGFNVGLLDADIYGPNQPHMLGATKKPASDGEKLSPVICHGLETMSMGYLLQERDIAMIWRGPMVSKALQQLVFGTHWGALDYLILDLPPGTGDVQLTMAQKMPIAGAVIVTTPQEIALLDVMKAVSLFKKVAIPILGVVENMSVYECPHCHHSSDIFGKGGGETMAKRYEVPWLGAIPLHQRIRETADSGQPIVLSDPAHSASLAYLAIVDKLLEQIGTLPKNRFPKIVVKNT